MKYLLDTHILLWALSAPEKLSGKHEDILKNRENELWISQFSYLEIAIKINLKKLPQFDLTFTEFTESVTRAGFSALVIQTSHIEQYCQLPLFTDHRDPFDRFLIATAKAENMPLLTVDQKFHLYRHLVEIV